MIKKLLALIAVSIISFSSIQGCRSMGEATGEGARETEESAQEFEEGYEEGYEQERMD